MSRKITWGAKISAAKKGHAVSQETKDKISRSKIGSKVSLETRAKISAFFKGRKSWSAGKKLSEEHKKNIGIGLTRAGVRPPIMIGPENPKWISDRSKLAKKQERNDSAYGYWREKVWLRDKFACKIGNPDCAGRIEAHHILGWKDHPELRYEVNNGITLCHFHHPRKRNDEMRLSPYFQNLVISEAK